MNRPDIIQRKASDAVVVSVVLLGKISTLTTLFQISLSACKDNGQAFEAGGGGALRRVRLYSWFPTYMNLGRTSGSIRRLSLSTQ
jgi:hypothetical protein